MKINIVGGIFGSSGYDSHTRSLANALYKVADVKLSTQLIPDWIKNVNDAELDMISKPERKDDWNIIITMPHMWKTFLGLGKNIGYCVWEGNKVPVSWIDEFLNDKIDLIFVPSEHTKQAILNTINIKTTGTFDMMMGWEVNEYVFNKEKIKDIIEQKIKIIPHGVNREIFYSRQKKVEDDGSNVIQLETQNNIEEENKTEQRANIVDNHADNIFKFVCNKGWRGTSWDRGGVQYLIKAFAEEFRKDEEVQLIIKLNPCYINPQIIGQSITALNLPEDRAPIHICSDLLSPQKLCDLYNSADCFVCPTRSESFNLPGLEAMSCGLPTIQTNFGGQTDYMTTNNSCFLRFNLEEVKEDIMYEGIQWATPDITDIRLNLRWAFEHRGYMKLKGKQAEEDSKNWTWDITANKIINSLNELKGGENGN